MAKQGRVHLVGAGPGDPDLLTVKAARLLAGAEVVVYDRLVSPAILSIIGPQARMIDVGKESGRHSVPQDRINAILAELALTGHDVVRLKGGDPYVFGRGGEEALYLTREGVPVEVVPGITAAVGVCAAAGIPLTHRGQSTSVRLITGHARDDHDLALNWDKLADPDCTLVFYMGLAAAPMISANLIRAGLPANTPAAAIQNGATDSQRRVLTTLADLPAAVIGLKPPTLLVVGNVVALAPELMPDSIEGWRKLEAAE